MEEVSGGTGIASELALRASEYASDFRVISRDLGKQFVPHGSVSELLEHCKLDAASVADFIQGMLEYED